VVSSSSRLADKFRQAAAASSIAWAALVGRLQGSVEVLDLRASADVRSGTAAPRRKADDRDAGRACANWRVPPARRCFFSVVLCRFSRGFSSPSAAALADSGIEAAGDRGSCCDAVSQIFTALAAARWRLVNWPSDVFRRQVPHRILRRCGKHCAIRRAGLHVALAIKRGASSRAWFQGTRALRPMSGIVARPRSRPAQRSPAHQRSTFQGVDLWSSRAAPGQRFRKVLGAVSTVGHVRATLPTRSALQDLCSSHAVTCAMMSAPGSTNRCESGLGWLGSHRPQSACAHPTARAPATVPGVFCITPSAATSALALSIRSRQRSSNPNRVVDRSAHPAPDRDIGDVGPVVGMTGKGLLCHVQRAGGRRLRPLRSSTMRDRGQDIAVHQRAPAGLGSAKSASRGQRVVRESRLRQGQGGRFQSPPVRKARPCFGLRCRSNDSPQIGRPFGRRAKPWKPHLDPTAKPLTRASNMTRDVQLAGGLPSLKQCCCGRFLRRLNQVHKPAVADRRAGGNHGIKMRWPPSSRDASDPTFSANRQSRARR